MKKESSTGKQTTANPSQKKSGIKPRSAKNKGMRFQKYIVEEILKTYPTLTMNDIRSTPASVTGSDVWLSEAALKLFPYSVECKCVEKLNIWSALKQAESANREQTPLLIFKRNRTETFCCLKFEDFLNLIKEDSE